MADSKITALGSIGTGTDPANDQLVIVDVSDVLPTGMATTGTTKRVGLNQLLSSSPTATGAFSVTGLVTAGSAAVTGAATVGTTLGVTGDLTVNTNVLKVDTTNDRVGIGTATPGVRCDILSDNNTSLAAILRVNSNNAAVNTALAYDGLIASGGMTLQAGTSASIVFNTNGATERARFNSTGNLAFVTGKGIDFAAVTGGTGTATANVLNDYEEGTFTPTIIGITTAGVGVYVDQSGLYTKVGRQVTVQIFLNWTAHTGTGNIRLTGLPFTSSSSFQAASVGYWNNIAITASNTPMGYVVPSAANIELLQMASGGGAMTPIPIDVSGGLMISATYFV